MPLVEIRMGPYNGDMFNDVPRQVAIAAIKKDPFCPADYEPSDRVIEGAMEHTGLTGGTCPACLAMRASVPSDGCSYPEPKTGHAYEMYDLGLIEGDGYGVFDGNVKIATEAKTETVTINGMPYHRLVATGTNSIDTTSEGMAGKADEVMKGILDGTLSRPKVKQIGDAVAERTKKDSGGDALGGAIGRSIRHGSFMERRTPYSD